MTNQTLPFPDPHDQSLPGCYDQLWEQARDWFQAARHKALERRHLLELILDDDPRWYSPPQLLNWAWQDHHGPDGRTFNNRSSVIFFVLGLIALITGGTLSLVYTLSESATRPVWTIGLLVAFSILCLLLAPLNVISRVGHYRRELAHFTAQTNPPEAGSLIIEFLRCREHFPGCESDSFLGAEPLYRDATSWVPELALTRQMLYATNRYDQAPDHETPTEVKQLADALVAWRTYVMSLAKEAEAVREQVKETLTNLRKHIVRPTAMNDNDPLRHAAAAQWLRLFDVVHPVNDLWIRLHDPDPEERFCLPQLLATQQWKRLAAAADQMASDARNLLPPKQN